MAEETVFESQQDRWTKNKGNSNAFMLQNKKNMDVHASEGVDFGFLPFIAVVFALLAFGVFVARRSEALAWVFFGALAVLGIYLGINGAVQRSSAQVSEGLLAIGTAIAALGLLNSIKRSRPGYIGGLRKKSAARVKAGRTARA